MKRTYTTLGGKKKKKAKVQKNTLLNNFLTGVNTAKKILDAKEISDVDSDFDELEVEEYMYPCG